MLRSYICRPNIFSQIRSYTAVSTSRLFSTDSSVAMAGAGDKYAKGFVDFVNKSPSPFHAVENSIAILNAAGFKEVHEREPFNIQPGGKYYYTRNRSAIVAFAVGGQYKAGNGFNITAAHTDSPCPKLKPTSDMRKSGFHSVGVQMYGGGIWATWFDRDLTIAGRVLVKNGEGVSHHLVHVTDRPILRIPTIAIHLERTHNEAFKFNPETHLTPVLATSIKAALNGHDEKKETDPYTQVGRHSPVLLDIIAKEIGCQAGDIMDFEMCVVDSQPATFGGANREFVFSPRLDNLLHTYCSITALAEACEDGAWLAEEPNVQMVVCFDNEEVGSQSQYGAMSNLLPRAIERIVNDANPEVLDMALQRSVIISADTAHAWHPNYSEKHEENHKPMFHKGPVIKVNANQRYATTAVTGNVLKALAARNNIPIQEVVVRNDSPCGTTIGPMSSAGTGVRTVDIGNPMLSMHSIREMCGADDFKHCVDLCRAFHKQWSKLEEKWNID